MKNLKLLKLFLGIAFLLFTQASQAQCPTSDITLSTQAEVDAFATDYPSCSILSELLWIDGLDITNLNGLSGLIQINNVLVLVLGNTSITSYNGLQNITHIDEAYIGNNNSITSNTGFEGLTSAKLIFFTTAPTIIDLTIFSNLETVTRKFSVSGPALTSLMGLESLTTVGSGMLTDRFSVGGHVLASLEGLNKTNNSHFTILHSIDGRSWNNRKTVAGAGNSVTLQTYKVVDTHPSKGINYYQIQQTDFDGAYSFSNIVSVELASEHPIVYPNPVNGKIQIQMEDGNTLSHLKLTNLVGQTVYQVNFAPTLDLRQKELSVADLAPGYYHLIINHQPIPSPLIIQ